MTQSKVNTSKFFRSHMKQPRGYGIWMFETKDGEYIGEHIGRYSEACDRVLAYARLKDIPEVFVSP